MAGHTTVCADSHASSAGDCISSHHCSCFSFGSSTHGKVNPILCSCMPEWVVSNPQNAHPEIKLSILRVPHDFVFCFTYAICTEADYHGCFFDNCCICVELLTFVHMPRLVPSPKGLFSLWWVPSWHKEQLALPSLFCGWEGAVLKTFTFRSHACMLIVLPGALGFPFPFSRVERGSKRACLSVL